MALRCLILAALWLSVMAYAADRPNIVVFVIDDLGYMDLGCYGSTFYETPHIDQLAAEGVRFTSGYAACPVCSPSRAALVTGKYPQRLAITEWIDERRGNQPDKWNTNTPLLPAEYEPQLPLTEITVAELLRDAGYATFFAGKWHLGTERYWPEHQGFEVNVAGCSWGNPRADGGGGYFAPYRNPRLTDGPAGEYLNQRLASEAASFIDTHRDRPFFLYLPHYAVHTPLEAPGDLVAKYEAKARSFGKVIYGNEHGAKVRQTQNHPTYAAMVATMDSAIGQVLDKLDERKLSDSTLVVFTSDNGGLSTAEGTPTSNVPLRAGKGWTYEGGIRVPWILRWPGQNRPGTTCDTPICSCDLLPTLTAAAGIPSESLPPIDGVNLLPLLNNGDIAPRALYWHYPHYSNQLAFPSSAIRDGDWKLIESYENGEIELYNLQHDLGEQHNRVADEPEIAARLAKSLASWRDVVGARYPSRNPNYTPQRPRIRPKPLPKTNLQ